MRNAVRKLFALIRRDPVLSISGLLAILSAFLIPPDRDYLSYIDYKVLICLFALMIAVELLQEARLFSAAAGLLINRVHGLRRMMLVLTAMTFLSSMILTNDVALLTFVPLTLIIGRVLDDRKALIRMVVLQTIAANAGSMLTPIGNPQNLYLYAHGGMTWTDFWSAVWPVGLAGGILLVLCIAVAPDASLQARLQAVSVRRDRNLVLSLLIFPMAVACVFGLYSEWLLLAAVLLLLLPLQRKVFLRADYALLLTFVFFFVFIGNISRLPMLRDAAVHLLNSPRRVILAGSLLSQVISNVPAAILLSGFTGYWRELLRGVDVGGCGTLIASLASVISWRLFSREETAPQIRSRYLAVFGGYNLIFLAVLLAVALLF